MTTKIKQLEDKKVPKLRFPGFLGEWKDKKLEDLLVFKNGLNADKESYGNGKGYKFINVLDIINNKFITHDKIIGTVDVTENDFQKNIVEYGDVLFQRSSETREEVGQANVYLDKVKPATFGGFVIRGKKKFDYNPIFINYLLKTSKLRKDITSKSGGSTRYNIGQESLQGVEICIPQKDEQDKVSDFLVSVENYVENLRAQKENLENYKKGMMQKIFSQEIRFKDENGNNFPDWEEKRLGDCLEYEQPTNYIVESTEYDDAYCIPVLTAGKSFILGHTNEVSGIFNVGLPIIIFDDFTTTSQFVDFSFKVKSSAMKILKPKDNMNIKFLFEAMQLIKYEIGGHGRHWISKYSNIKIFVPSLPEQKKIAEFVLILDNLIKSKQQGITQAEQWKKGLTQKMFI